MIPGIANSLLQTFDFPVAFVPSAKGGSNLYVNGELTVGHRTSNHFDTSTLYGQSITKAQKVGGVELIIMHQGEADLSDGRTEANYEADFATMIGHYREDLYSNIPIFICQLGTVGSGTDAELTGIRNAQHDVDNGTSIFMGATAMDLPRMDTWHYTTPALTVIGSRLANAIKYYFGRSTYYRGPSIDSAFFSDANRNRVIVTLSHHGGTDITPATGITGFAVFDNGSGVTVGSAARYSSDAVLLTLSRSIAAGHTATLAVSLRHDTERFRPCQRQLTSGAPAGEHDLRCHHRRSDLPRDGFGHRGGGNPRPSASTSIFGGSATITITPDSGMRLASLTDNGSDVLSQISGGSYVITNLSAAHDVVGTSAARRPHRHRSDPISGPNAGGTLVTITGTDPSDWAVTQRSGGGGTPGA